MITPWYAHISKPSQQVILHMQGLRTLGREDTPLADPAAVLAFLAAHPEVDAVVFYAAWMPRRPVPVARVTLALVQKLFG